MINKDKNKSIPESLYTSGEVARYCHTTVMQVNRWIKNKDLKAFRYPGGHYRITKEEFKSFLKRNNMPIIDDYFREQHGKKILIADDDKNVVDAIHRLFSKKDKDFKIEIAYDGYEALIKAGDFKPDLIILDILMPKIDGLEICRRLRKDKTITPGIKILVITGYSDAYDRETVLANGADDYLLKPFDTQSIVKSVEKLLK